MPGRILKFEELSSPAIDQLDKNRTSVMLAVSPIEGHGPHLPLGVDYFDALYFADRAAELTVQKRPDFDVVIYPGIPLGTQIYRQPGSVRIKSGVLYDVIVGIGDSLALWGFKYIFLFSGHGSPKDIVALESACAKVSRKRGIQMHNLSGALAIRFLRGEFIDKISANMPEPLSPEDSELLRKDVHAGWWETSMMLWLKPQLVNEQYKSLPDNEKKKGSSGSSPGYFGMPSKANAEFAEASMKVLVNEVGIIIENCLADMDITSQTRSPIFNILFLRPKFKKHTILAAALFINILIISWLIYNLISR